jgi:Cu-Zn family superoxide dismutase
VVKFIKGAIMVRIRPLVLSFVAAALSVVTGCQHEQTAAAPPAPMTGSAVVAVAQMRPSQAATTQPLNNNVTGTVTFTQTADGVSFVADIDGFEPNTKHGFHIHDKGDLSAPNLSSAGGHFNPTHEAHGGPNSPHHHLGDLGNLEADANGHAHLEGTMKGVALTAGDPLSILGRSVIIHAKEDDEHSQPAGNSGARIAGGIIVLSK